MPAIAKKGILYTETPSVENCVTETEFLQSYVCVKCPFK